MPTWTNESYFTDKHEHNAFKYNVNDLQGMQGMQYIPVYKSMRKTITGPWNIQ